MDDLSDIKGRLFPYQVEGVRFIVRCRGRVLLFDEQGLGKTAQTIVATYILRAFPMLVICPKSLVLNWRDEVLKWLAGRIDPADVVVLKNGRTEIRGRVAIVPYGLARNRVEELKAFKPVMVAMDEAQACKERTTEVTKALIPLARQVPGCILATGTPILNRPAELYPLLVAHRLRDLGDFFTFARRYCDAKEKVIKSEKVIDPKTGEEKLKLHKRWDFSGASNLDELNRRLAPTMLRRRRADVLPELPELLRVRLSVDGVAATGEELRELCRQAVVEAGGDIGQAFGAVRFMLGETGPAKLLAAYRDLGMRKAGAAVEWLCENVDEGNPAVVFAHHLIVVDTVLAGVREGAGLTAAAIVGAVSPNERHRLVTAFQAGEIDVLVCGITAASTGLTLTRAAQMLAVELPWSPKTAEQMEARLVRIGQTRGVVARYMVAEGTLDEHIWAMLGTKSEHAGQAIDGWTCERFEEETREERVGQWGVVRRMLQAEAAAAGYPALAA